MRKVALSLVMVLSLLSAAEAQVKVLPEDGDKWHLTVFGDSPPSMDADPRLVEIKSKSHYRAIKESDPVFPRYKEHVGTLPVVMLQAPNGYVIYECSGEAMPKSESELAEEMLAAIEKHRPKPVDVPDLEAYSPYIQITLLLAGGRMVDAGSMIYQELNQR